MSLLTPYQEGELPILLHAANVKEILVQFWCSWNGRHGNY